MTDTAQQDLQRLTADIVAAYVSHNKIDGAAFAELISTTYRALSTAGMPRSPEEPQTPKPDRAAIRKSLTPDYLTSFIDGRQYKSLKRHLASHGLTGAEYRERYGLPSDYPLVAPNYSAARSALAKGRGFGRKVAASPPSAPAEPVAEAKPRKAARTRGKAIQAQDETFA